MPIQIDNIVLLGLYFAFQTDFLTKFFYILSLVAKAEDSFFAKQSFCIIQSLELLLVALLCRRFSLSQHRKVHKGLLYLKCLLYSIFPKDE